MALEKTLEYRLRLNDFDRYNNIKPDTVLDIFQDLATLQAEEMGIGRDHMLEENVIWVVVRIKFEVFAQPERDIVVARTWPHTPSRFSFLRDFEIKDLQGNLIVRGASEWVLMNAETRKFESVTDHYHGSSDFSEDRAFETKPKKVPPLKEPNEALAVITPRVSDIDINGHVNNARYPQFVLDALELDEQRSIRTFQIDYRYEIKLGAPIAIHAEEQDDTIIACGVLEDGTVAFNCKIELG